MDDGNLSTNLHFRHGDNFVDVADQLNSVIDNYRDRIGRAQALLEDDAELSPQNLKLLKRELDWFDTRVEEGDEDEVD